MVWRILRRPIDRLKNHRSAVLALIGLIEVFYGLGVLTSDSPGVRFGAVATIVGETMTSGWFGLVWIACGLVGIAVSVSPTPDVWGFKTLMVPPAAWTAFYLWSWVTWAVTGGELGSGRAWVSAVTWSGWVLVVLVTASWPDERGRS